MLLQLNMDRVKELLCDFHILTGIRIVIFDDACRELLAYPEHHSAFCSLMKADCQLRQTCRQSDMASFETCKKTGRLVVYHCHAGLIEATAPILDQGLIIGYIMFGQLTDRKDRHALIRLVCDQYANKTTGYSRPVLTAAIRKVRYRSMNEILAAAKILEAITSYVLLHELISVKHERLIEKIDLYIADHITEPITSHQLCQLLHIGRTRLYELSRQSLGMGIAAYITMRRMEMARSLLVETDCSIAQIAIMTGYNDYTYFCKVFRKAHQATPTGYRRKSR
ncbi:MAG: PocR ligand-binding domain-containing protein [Bacillota bacterium]|nr:PocR ligand-binding domain-containing protein [Bacillota bacterium]